MGLNFLVDCTQIQPVINFVKGIFQLVQIVVPIGLILMGSIDLGRAVLSSDDKEIKQATGKLVKRAIAAVAIFFLVFLVGVVMNLVSSSNSEDEGASQSWISCWNDADA